MSKIALKLEYHVLILSAIVWFFSQKSVNLMGKVSAIE